MLSSELDSRTRRHPHHQRDMGLPPGHVAQLGSMVGQLVKTDAEKVHDHDLGDRALTRQCRACGGTDDRRLRDRGVPHAVFAVLSGESLGDVVDTASGIRDVLAEQEDVGIAAQSDVERGVDCCSKTHDGHQTVTSATTSLYKDETSGSGLANAYRNASSTS